MVASRVPAFDALLYSLVKARGLSLREFAERVDYPHTGFSNIKAGQRPVPLDRAPAWADALGLVEGHPKRDRFLDLAALTHLPAEARIRLERVLQRMDDLEVKHEALRRMWADQDSRQLPARPPPPPPPRR